MNARTAAPARLVEAAAAGDRVALARLLSLVERGGAPSAEVARLAYAAPVPYTVGITGAPGAGKSTLTNRLLSAVRRGWSAVGGADAAGTAADGAAGTAADGAAGTAADGAAGTAAGTAGGDAGGDAGGETAGGAAGAAGTAEGAQADEVAEVAVLAVDPSSPFSGGAILGDRVRMQQHATDPSVFIRSMATRGHLGGLALAVPDAVRVLGAAGFPVVVVETVGVGQMEVDVAAATDTTVVVVTPGWGDAMQANKAGLLEIADLFVINKADRPGVHEARRDLEQMLDLSKAADWRPPVLTTVASSGEGVEDLWRAIARHRAHLLASGALEARRAERVAHELRRVLAARTLEAARARASGDAFDDAVRAIAEGTLDPYSAADELLGPLGGEPGGR